MFDFAAVKARVRQTVHDTFGILALYVDDQSGVQEELRVRFHTKINRFGDLQDAGWAEVVEGVNRLILNKTELDLKEITPVRGARLVFIPASFEGLELILQVQEPSTGPVDVVWQVSQK